MKYRLKDQKLQKKLDEISGGCFSEAFESIKKPKVVVFQARNGGPAMSISLTDQDIEALHKYDPNKWNFFPEVTPPMEVDMRVEVREGCGFMAWWDGKNWRTGSHSYSKAQVVEGVFRYRLWE